MSKKMNGFVIIGKISKLLLPADFKWPRPPEVFIDTTGSSIIIEKDVSISSGVYIMTHSHHFNKSNWRELPIITNKNPTILKEKCFIGTNAIILYSCKYIGKCSVIGAGSIVNRDIPDYEIWVGNPIRKIGEVEKIE